MRSVINSLVNRPDTQYTVRQKLLSGSLGLAMTGSFAGSAALAHVAFPMPNFANAGSSASAGAGATSTYVPASPHYNGAGNHGSSGGNGAGTAIGTKGWNFSGGSISGSRSVNGTANSGTADSGTAHSGTANYGSASNGASNSAFQYAVSHTLHPIAGVTLQNVKTTSQSLISATANARDLELNSNAAIFSAGSLAGFHQITIDIGGKQEVLGVNSQLTAAELVAAQQVLSGGKQTLVINANGIATGGTFTLNSSTLSSLDSAVGGAITGLDISHGVVAIDTLSSLNLMGSLVNQGTLDYGAAAGVKGQTDIIAAANITNTAGAVIAAAGSSSGLSSAGLALNASNSVSNSGKISNTTDIAINAPTITNSGVINSSGGNITLSGAGGNLTVNGSGGTVQAVHGDININAANYNGAGNVTVSGGNWLSNNFNINDGSGASNVSVDQLTGVVNVTAGSSHLTAETADLKLGASNISGDPTYYNTSGSITIDSDISVTGGEALAVVASGNIVGNGGTINTAGGTISLIAGANFASGTTGGTGLTTTPPGGDTSTTIVVENNSKVAGNGSTTGGYIDLSGITLTGTKSNTPITSISSNGGDILMVAYKGTGTNSGSIVATATTAQTGGATTVDAGSGSVTMIGGGAQITAQSIAGGNVTILAGTPTLSGSLNINDGNLSGATYSVSSVPSATAINLGGTAGTNAITASGDVTISTAGKVTGTAAAPLEISASGLSFTGTTAAASLFVESTGTGALALNDSSVATGATLSVIAKGALNIDGTISAGALNKTTGFISGGTVDLSSGGDLTINSGNVVSGTTVNLSTINTLTGATGTGSISSAMGTGLISATTGTITTGSGDINVNTAVNTLTVTSATNTAAINESASAGKALSLLASTIGPNGTFTLNSSQPVSINGTLTDTNGTVNINESGTTTSTVNGATSVAGITIAKAINVGTTGKVSLATTGNENIIEKSVTLTASAITINAAAAVGTTGAPFATDTSTLVVNGNSTNPVSIKDLGTTAFTVSGSGFSGTGESISINSKAATFTVNGLSYTNVSLTDTVVGATTTLSGTQSIGDGTGNVTVSTAGNITQASGSTGGLNGDLVTLTTTGGAIGTSSTPVNVSTAGLLANAIKGSVYVDGLTSLSVGNGTALSNYSIKMAPGQTLYLDGILKATTALTGVVSLAADAIVQDLATGYLGAANVQLSNLSSSGGGSLGLGTGFQSIQTKAVNSLTVTDKSNDASPFVAFVAQTGNLVLSSGSVMTGGSDSTLNLALGLGNKLTVENGINYTNLNITAPTSLTVSTGGQLEATNLTITSPIVALSAASSINLQGGGSGSLNFVSTGALSITGPSPITIPTGETVSISGQTGITLGAPSTGINNPLSAIGGTGGGTGPLSSLTVFTAGVFSGAYSQFNVSAGSNDTLSFTAASFKNTAGTTTGPFLLEASGSGSNSITYTLTGSTPLVIDTTPLTTPGTNPHYDVVLGGSTGGSVSLATGGVLTVENAGLNVNPASGNSIALKGQSLILNNATGLASDAFSDGKYSSVSLTVNLNTFFLGVPVLGSATTDAFNGPIVAQNVFISGPTITINNSQTITGTQVVFDTANYNLNTGSSVTGVTAGAINPSLSILNFVGNGLTIGGSATNPGGTYSGFSSVLVQSAESGITLGQLFTSSALLGTGSGVNNIAISAGGSILLPQSLSTLGVTAGGSVYLSGSILVYSPLNTNPQPYLKLSAPDGSVSLLLGTGITLGKAKGDYDIEVNTNAATPGTGFYTVKSSLGALNVAEALDTAGGSLTGLSVLLNQDVTTTGQLQVTAQGSTSSVINGNGYTLSAGTLILGQGNTTLPAITTVLNISTGNLEVVTGGLRLNNEFAGDVSVTQLPSSGQLSALALTNSSGLNGTSSTLTINPLSTTNGSIDIVNSNGQVVVAPNANLGATNGSITIENNDLTSTIEVGTNVVMKASAIAGNLGDVYITMGPVPTAGLVAGGQPGPSLPITNITLGSHVYYSTTAHPLSSITSLNTNGPNSLYASGRNIVFNTQGVNSAITLDGNDSITADPPPVAAVAAVANQSQTVTSQTNASSLSNLLSAQAPNVNAETIQIAPLNWSLPTTFAINSSLADSVSNALGAAGTPTSNTGTPGVVAADADLLPSVTSNSLSLEGLTGNEGRKKSAGSEASIGSKTKLLTGGVSNAAVKSFEQGVELIAPKERSTFNTKYGAVNVASGAVAMVMAFDGGIAVYNLHDTRSGAVTIKIGENTIAISPGQNVVLTDKAVKCFEEINPAHSVAYRNVSSRDWGNGLKGFYCDFSVISLMQGYSAFRQSMKEQDSAGRKVFSNILKTSAILMQIGGAPYEYMNTPPVTAMTSR